MHDCIIEENVTPGVTIVGYKKFVKDPLDKAAAMLQIKKITRSNNETLIQWATGSTPFTYSWDNRNNYTYV